MNCTEVSATKCSPARAVNRRPRTDILEEGGELKLVLDLPGVAPDRCEVTLEKGVLEIVARGIEPPEGRQVRLRESRVGHYRRAFQLPDDVDPEAVRAGLEHGVLTVHLPKAATARPRRIDVQVSG